MNQDQMAQAGRYVLGLLEGAELTAFEVELARDAELRAAVDRLQASFRALDDTAKPEAAGTELWSAIERRLDEPLAENVMPLPSRRVSIAQWMSMAAGVVVALGLGYFAGNLGSRQPQPLVVAVLVNQTDAAPGAIVEAFADDRVRLVPLEDFVVAADQVLQVWTLPDPATGPVSLGTFTDPHTIWLTGPQLPTPKEGQLYEITLEPAPGSPTGKPTGPILVKGFAKTPV
ncbi:anti-sigma factor domain-containing protein [Devosia sp. ZW T5_3]|uniref:anti-sigma factor n=1 Tax=Devosia sp. ZW T5_3 TaxID=3378085 RepID=UPI00385485C1